MTLRSIIPILILGLSLTLPAALLSPAPLRSAPAAQGDGQRYRDPVFAGARVEVAQDRVYGRAVDIPSGQEVELKLDLYQVAGDAEPARALFVFVHGGGFTGGDKSRGRAYARALAEYGYVTASIGYRLRQGDPLTVGAPAAVEDARMAVAWLREQRDDLRIDPERILIGGSSAGAITALGLAYTDLAQGEQPRSSAVRGVVDWWGGLYGWVDQMQASDPPLAIIHGTEDRTVPFGEAEQLRARARAIGLPHAWWPLEGAGHAAHDVERDIPRVVSFFYPHLWPEASPSILFLPSLER